MILLIAALVFLSATKPPPGALPAGGDRPAACQATKGAEPAVVMRGRLFAANGGGSGYRIWPVGTRRVLWVSWRVDPPLPERIRQSFKPFDEELYGDFTLVPLSPDRPGVMREVCFVAGQSLVVQDVQTGARRRMEE